jgi:hypothetical protein
MLKQRIFKTHQRGRKFALAGASGLYKLVTISNNFNSMVHIRRIGNISHIQLFRNCLVGLFHDEFIPRRGILAEQLLKRDVSLVVVVDFHLE